MKTIGLLGGMSWESTVSYYSAINREINARLGGLHSAKTCLQSVDFSIIESYQHAGEWDRTADILAESAKAVEAGGAECLVICTNTMHKVFAEIETAISIPVIHIADATAAKMLGDGIKSVGLLGTRFTMEQDFYKGRLAEKFGIDVVVPAEDERQLVHKIIYDELCKGVIKQESREAFLAVIADLYQQGAEAVILGCTEISLLVEQADTDVPLYDTTAIHALAAVDFALAE
ncbi:MAG: aspartate/glutamate racemase family protein [Cobetia amphilecti]